MAHFLGVKIFTEGGVMGRASHFATISSNPFRQLVLYVGRYDMTLSAKNSNLGSLLFPRDPFEVLAHLTLKNGLKSPKIMF